MLAVIVGEQPLQFKKTTKQNRKLFNMKANGKTVNEILTNVQIDRIEPFNKLHEVIMKNLPKGF
jgi:ABC-type transport system involved in cytochrome bd biosynthesis fused ATPase/permease subunit